MRKFIMNASYPGYTVMYSFFGDFSRFGEKWFNYSAKVGALVQPDGLAFPTRLTHSTLQSVKTVQYAISDCGKILLSSDRRKNKQKN